MLKVLKEVYESKNPACFYTNNENTQGFHFGKIVALNEEEVCVQMLSPDGDFDGLFVMDPQSIYRVDLSGQYVEKMAKLCRKGDDLTFSFDEQNILRSILDFARSQSKVVSLELMDSGCEDIVGVVSKLEQQECCVSLIDEYGFADGESYFQLSDVTQLTMMRPEEKRIERLWEINTQLH